jgi:hypothetical protein
MSFESLRRIVSRAVDRSPISKDLQIARVSEAFRIVLDRLWGSERASLITFVSLREGILKCESTSPAAKQQMSVENVRIQNEVNRQLGDKVIHKILTIAKGF